MGEHPPAAIAFDNPSAPPRLSARLPRLDVNLCAESRIPQ